MPGSQRGIAVYRKSGNTDIRDLGIMIYVDNVILSQVGYGHEAPRIHPPLLLISHRLPDLWERLYLRSSLDIQMPGFQNI